MKNGTNSSAPLVVILVFVWAIAAVIATYAGHEKPVRGAAVLGVTVGLTALLVIGHMLRNAGKEFADSLSRATHGETPTEQQEPPVIK